MDEAVKQLVVTSPFLGLVVLGLVKVYGDLMSMVQKVLDNNEEARRERETIAMDIQDLKSRVKRIEQEVTGDVSPTQARRPDQQ